MISRARLFPLLGALVIALLFAACTGPMPAEDDEPDEREEEVAEPEALVMADHEDFDPSAYEEDEPDLEVEVEHEAPEALMSGHADRGTTQTMEGYRVQVFSSQERSDAESVYERANNWWEGLDDRPEGLLADELPVYITYRQPYYRVRIGDFRTRSEAEQALEYVRSEFSDAFISPDTVTITR